LIPNVKVENGVARIEISDNDLINAMTQGIRDDIKAMMRIQRTETGYSVFISVEPLIARINRDFRVQSGEDIDLVTAENPNVELKINRHAIKTMLSKMFKNGKITDAGDKFIIEIALPNPSQMPANPAGMLGGMFGQNFNFMNFDNTNR